MPGFLDPDAVSIEAEYTRYLDRDILGKIIFKNFAINVLGLEQRQIRIPVSRHGDVGNYKDLCDAGLRIGARWYSVETKCSLQTVAKRTRLTEPSPRWNFSKLLRSATSGRDKNEFEMLFAVGINSPGLEDSQEYWRYLHRVRKRTLAEGRPFDLSVWPHDAAFLTRCGFYIMPRTAIHVNQLDVTIAAIERRADYEFFSWGDDFARLRHIWQHAINCLPS